MTIAAIVTDLEGTTTSIDFVKDTLFPYSRARIRDFVAAHGHEPAVRAILAEVATMLATTLATSLATAIDDEQVVATLIEWIDADRKVGALKALQGMIWAAGYAAGDFVGHLYPDAYATLGRWHAGGIALYVYSSGSVHAQRLLFEHSGFGDLRPWFTDHFDTGIGTKQDSASYQRIIAAIGQPAEQVLFLSDVTAELDAAAAAGLRTCQVVRPGTLAGTTHPVARDFSAIHLD